MASPMNADENTKMYDALKGKWNGGWVGRTDSYNEGEWISIDGISTDCLNNWGKIADG